MIIKQYLPFYAVKSILLLSRSRANSRYWLNESSGGHLAMSRNETSNEKTYVWPTSFYKLMLHQTMKVPSTSARGCYFSDPVWRWWQSQAEILLFYCPVFWLPLWHSFWHRVERKIRYFGWLFNRPPIYVSRTCLYTISKPKTQCKCERRKKTQISADNIGRPLLMIIVTLSTQRHHTQVVFLWQTRNTLWPKVVVYVFEKNVFYKSHRLSKY